ncbi:flagellar biosynthetic protein FliO [Massilia sp. erpn]|uniref:flagellar biosynthetic protein FliO n=1 Tax=Massilia sp. erpn TaxID=2738142 RepID=UPI002107A63A|nr:flagellar biosynthetic protein FliO [Massilia sp. erpn]UTY59313.1 flagellar biosynthetic protein FliO [Massilia sp. erpn]
MRPGLRQAAALLAGAALSGLARAEPAASAIPFKRADAAASGAGGAGLALLLLSVLAIALVYWLRRRLRLTAAGGADGRLLRVLETRRLGPRALVSVVEFGGQHYLLAQSEQGVSCVASAPAPVPAAVDAAAVEGGDER